MRSEVVRQSLATMRTRMRKKTGMQHGRGKSRAAKEEDLHQRFPTLRATERQLCPRER
jgi:hypothetical protein